MEKKYDLIERTAKLAENVIELAREIHINELNRRIIEQVIGSAGSIGANYSEATESESRKDFIHKMAICKKEIKETLHWLRLLLKTNREKNKEISPIQKETHELLLIFSKILTSTRNNQLINS